MDRGLTAEIIESSGIGFADIQANGLYNRMRQLNYSDEMLIKSGLFKYGQEGSLVDIFNNRIIIPIIDLEENVVSFSGISVFGRQPVYLNLPNTEVFDGTKDFYGINQISVNEPIMICEGIFDVIYNNAIGIKNVISTFGHEFTPYHAKTVHRLSNKACICYDNDYWGQKMAHRAIEMRCPEGEDAVKIVDFYLKQKQIADDVDAREIANILNGRSCAELETIVNEAGMYAAFDNRDRITHNDLIRSCLRYIFEAPEMLTATNNEEVRITAIHEAGHALVAEILDPGSVNLISVAGYDGNISGITSIHKPAGYKKSKELQEHRITGVLAGKAATEIVSGTVDMGVNSDMHKAFDMIEKFVDNVCAYGFDSFDRHGASSIPRENRDRMLVREMDKFYQIAKKTIIENRAFLDAIVEELLEKQTLTGRDIARIKTEVYKDVA